MKRLKVNIGDVYGKWEVLGGESKLGIHYQVFCRCFCGKKRFVTITKLISGVSKCCRSCAQTKHGNRVSINGKPSGEYVAWNNMRIRCYSKRSKDYNNYGGRGISVCGRWLRSFENFLKDMGNKPSKDYSLDRRDNDRGYDPDNCRWVIVSEQSKNRRCCN